MLALFPTVPEGHQVWATVEKLGLPLRYAPTLGMVIARLSEPPVVLLKS